MSVRRPVLFLALAALAACALAGAAAATDLPARGPCVGPGPSIPKAPPAAIIEAYRPPPPPACSPSGRSVSACREIVPDGCFRRWCPVHLGGGYQPPVCEIYCTAPY